MSFPDFVFNTNPIQDIFLFPVITLNNSLCHTTPQHSAVSIHQMDWADTLGIIASYPNPFSSHPMEVFWPSGNCPECPSIQLPFANEPNPNGSPHRYYKTFTTHPPQSANTQQFHFSPNLNLPRSTQEQTDVIITSARDPTPHRFYTLIPLRKDGID